MPLVAIGELCDFTSGNGFTPRDWKTSGLPIIRIQNLNGSRDFNYYQGAPDPLWLINPGDLLFAWAGVKGVSFGPTIWNGPQGVLNQHIYRVRPRSHVDAKWLYYALLEVTAEIEKKAHGFKTSLVHVHKSDITRAKVALTDPDEQHKIAEVLLEWDAAIEKTEKLIEAKEKRFSWLRGQSIHANAAQCKHPRISDVADRVQRKTDGGTYPILTISSASGFVLQKEKYSRFMAGKSLEDYILLQQGEFAYNKGNSLRYQFGCIFQLQNYDAALVPHVYVCFKLRDSVDPGYLSHVFQADYLKRQLGAIVNSGVRNNGLLNIRPNEFMKVTVPIPPLDLQRRIAATLNNAQQEIDLLKQQAAAYRKQKRGLMQKLLTGEWRVKTSKEGA
jgi:type I restriction enzyme S subunit